MELLAELLRVKLHPASFRVYLHCVIHGIDYSCRRAFVSITSKGSKTFLVFAQLRDRASKLLLSFMSCPELLDYVVSKLIPNVKSARAFDHPGLKQHLKRLLHVGGLPAFLEHGLVTRCSRWQECFQNAGKRDFLFGTAFEFVLFSHVQVALHSLKSQERLQRYEHPHGYSPQQTTNLIQAALPCQDQRYTTRSCVKPNAQLAHSRVVALATQMPEVKPRGQAAIFEFLMTKF